MKKKGKGTHTLTYQVFTFFLASILIADIISFYVIKNLANRSIMKEKETITQGIALDVDKSIKEYASYEWVLEYLLDHKDENLDLEYDSSSETNVKVERFSREYPGLNMQTIMPATLNSLPETDQRLFAEIVYNKWLSRFNDLKISYDIEFIYIFASNDDYLEDTFILSGSDGNLVRGTELGNAYIFGTKVINSEEQTDFFRKINSENERFVYTNDYLDTYRYMFKIGDMNFITGMTFDIASIRKSIDTRTYQFLIAFIILQSILTLICRYMLGVFAIHPIKDVEKNVNEYAATKDGAKVRHQLEQIKVDNEIGALADGIYEMICEIESHVKEIKEVTAENERISVELDLARKIQIDMLPSTFPPFPEKKQFDLYATTDPAKEVGGDFYDFFMLDDDHIVLLIADVSGKGVPASLFMAIAKALLKNRVMTGGTTSEVLRDVNIQLSEGNEEGMFVTVWIAIINIHTGEGIASNAGHEHPVLRHKNGEFELVKYRHSMAVAYLPGVKFEEHSFKLEPGDRIFVYTDGLPESRRDDGEFYGTDRMLEALNMNPDAEFHELLDNVKTDIATFIDGAEQFDDVTMLAFDYYGEEKNS